MLLQREGSHERGFSICLMGRDFDAASYKQFGNDPRNRPPFFIGTPSKVVREV